MELWLDIAPRWIVYTFFDASELLAMIDVGYNDAIFTNPIFWNQVWLYLKPHSEEQTSNTRITVLQKLLMCPYYFYRPIKDVRVLCRTQLEPSIITTGYSLGFWARSQHFFKESEMLFALENITQKFLVAESTDTNNFNEMSRKEVKVHGIVKQSNSRIPVVFNALENQFQKDSMDEIFDLKKLPKDYISPLIENPFIYYKKFVLDLITDYCSFERRLLPATFLIILYPQIHKKAISELFVWHLTKHGHQDLIPFLIYIDYQTISCVGWFAQYSRLDDNVIIDFGYYLVDYIKLKAKKYIDGEMILQNPFSYIKFYVRDTRIQSVRIHHQIDAEQIVYKGSYITLKTECKTIKKTYDLYHYNNALTLKQFMNCIWELYCHTLTKAEYEAILQEKGILSYDDEYYAAIQKESPQGEAAYFHFIWNHHNITGLCGLKYTFICCVHEEN